MYHKIMSLGLGLLCILLLPLAYGEERLEQLRDNRFASSEVCSKCHKEIYSKWKDSMHAQSISDPIFQTSYMESYLASQGKSKKLCLSCHAPTTQHNKDWEMKKKITREGVTCHFCHSIVNVDLAKKDRFQLDVGKTIRGPSGKGNANFHGIEKSTLHKKSEFCAGCHEYESNGIKIMSTYSEWKKGPYAAKGIQCQNCHMPLENIITAKGEKKRQLSHYLAGGHSIMQLKKAVKLKIGSIKRGKDRITIEVEVENSGSGHSIPTGIPTRKLVLYTMIKTSDKRTIKRSITYEKVIFDAQGRELTRDSDIMIGLGSQIISDNRIAPGEKRKEKIVFYTNPNVEVSVTAWLDYIYSPQLVQPTEMKIEMAHSEKFFER